MTADGGASEDNKDTSVDPWSRARRTVAELFNLAIIRDAIDDLRSVNWYVFSNTAFHLGVFGLIIWAVPFSVSFSVVNSDVKFSVIAILDLLLSLGLIGVPLFVLATVAQWSIGRMVTGPANGVETHSYRLVFVSAISLVAAVVYRWGLFTDNISFSDFNYVGGFGSVLLFDILYLSLILIGTGGIGSYLFQE